MGQCQSAAPKTKKASTNKFEVEIETFLQKTDVSKPITVRSDARSKLIYYLECCASVLENAGVNFDLESMKKDSTANIASAALFLFNPNTMQQLKVFEIMDRSDKKGNKFEKRTVTIKAEGRQFNQNFNLTKTFNPKLVNIVTKKWIAQNYIDPINDVNAPLTKFNQVLMFEKMGLIERQQHVVPLPSAPPPPYVPPCDPAT